MPLQSLLLWYYNSCTVGYNNFNNLVLLDHWWLQNLIPRHIKDICCCFCTVCALFASKLGKVLKWISIFLLYIYLYGVPKYAEFDADFEFWEKVAKNACEKSYHQKCHSKLKYLTFMIMYKSFQPIAFLGEYFCIVFNRFKTKIKCCVLWYPY